MAVVEALGGDHEVPRHVVDPPAGKVAELLADHPPQRRDVVLVADGDPPQQAHERNAPEQLGPAAPVQGNDPLRRDPGTHGGGDDRPGGGSREEIEALPGEPSGGLLERVEGKCRNDAPDTTAVDCEDASPVHVDIVR